MAYGSVNTGANGASVAIAEKIRELETKAEISQVELGVHTADLLKHHQALKNLVPQVGTETLANTRPYPFNNSETTVVLQTPTETTQYRVEVEVLSGLNVGEITVKDKQLNGFKIAYSGSCPEANLKYFVIGGY